MKTHIFERFIKELAPEQVNLSAEVVEEVEREVGKGKGKSVMDPALDEVIDLLKKNSYNSFLESKYAYAYLKHKQALFVKEASDAKKVVSKKKKGRGRKKKVFAAKQQSKVGAKEAAQESGAVEMVDFSAAAEEPKGKQNDSVVLSVRSGSGRSLDQMRKFVPLFRFALGSFIFWSLMCGRVV